MKHILFLSKGTHSASTRYRAFQFFEPLERAGFVPHHIPITGTMSSYWHAIRAARQADIVVVLRKLFPAPLLWLLRKNSRKLVFDFDDAIFCNSDGSASPTRLRRFAAIVGVSDHVFAGNHFLQEKTAAYNAAVTCLPTAIEPEKYACSAEKPADRIDLVWIGSRSTRKYLELAVPALNLAAEKVPGLTLKIIADFDLPKAGFRSIAIPWSAEREAQELAASHIGIAPMIENDWTRGKCALKVLQYMAAGLPVVSSRAGVNIEAVEHGKTGFLADTPEEWATAIEQLAGSAALRQQMGDAGRARVVERYSSDRVFALMRDVLTQLG